MRPRTSPSGLTGGHGETIGKAGKDFIDRVLEGVVGFIYMSKVRTFSAGPSLGVKVTAEQARDLFRLSTALADSLEEVLEAGGAFQPEFLRGVKKSLQEARTGRVKRVTSLLDVL